MKDAARSGMLKDECSKSKTMRHIRHHLQLALELPLSEANPSEPAEPAPPQPTGIQGGPAACAVVDEWRMPRSVTTLSFIDGYQGRLFITFREGAISQTHQNVLRKELNKYVFLDEPQEKSHVWNEETLIRYLSFLGQDLISMF